MLQFQIEALRDGPIADVFDRYLRDLRPRGYSSQSLDTYDSIYRRFLSWCERQGIKTVLDLNEQTMTAYQAQLTGHLITKAFKPLRPATRRTHLYTIGRAFAWMRKHGIINFDPLAELRVTSLR